MDLPAHFANYRSRGLAERLSANLSAGSPPYISIKGNRFAAIDATGNIRNVGKMDPQGNVFLDMVIADSNPHLSKLYFESAYDPNATEHLPPTCFSDNGVAPSSQAQRPQSETCAACPHNQWGSDTSRLTGKPTKACNDLQKIAVLLPEQPEMMFLMRIPPGSLKFFGKYVNEVASQLPNGMDVDAIVTRVSFDPKAVGILTFQPIKYVEADDMARMQAAAEKKEMDMLVGKTDKPYRGPVAQIAAVPATEERRLPPPAPLAQSAEKIQKPAENFLGAQTQITPLSSGISQRKPRGRPRKEAVQEAPATQAPFMPTAVPPGAPGEGPAAIADDLDVPNFLTRKTEPATPVLITDAPDFLTRKTEPATPPKGAVFGMVADAPEPPNDMQKRIDEALKLPT